MAREKGQDGGAPTASGGDGAAAPEGRAQVRTRIARRYPALAARLGAAGGDAPTIHDAATVAVDHKDGGRAVDASVRGPVEAHLGADLSGARVHDDPLARQASAAMGARAFAHGNDVFLGPGESDRDVGLMAHELTHVVQQGAAGRRAPQRAVQVGDANSPAEAQADAVATAVTQGATPSALLVDDGPVQSGQMLKSQFIDQLRPLVTAAANEELGPALSAIGCPYIDRYFSRYATQPASAGEAMIKRFAPATRSAKTAAAMMPAIVERVRAGVRTWRETGKPPPEIAAAEPAAAAAARPGTAGAQRAPAEPDSPARLRAELGAGEALDTRLSGAAAAAWGADLGDVRVHRGAVAQRMADERGARAFAVGRDIALASSVEPGTPVGDAIMAHELAHVVQQDGADPAHAHRAAAGEDSASEADAEQAAPGVLARLWTGAKGVASRALSPLRKTGFALQRCTEAGPRLITAEQYFTENATKLAQGVRDHVSTLPLTLPTNATLVSSAGAFNAAVVDDIHASDWKRLSDSLSPESLRNLINGSRVRASLAIAPASRPSEVQIYERDEGPPDWFPEVGVKIGDAILPKVVESVRRMVPRYLASADTGAPGPVHTTTGTADLAKVQVSHPMDVHVLEVLRGPLVKFDFAGYASSTPAGKPPPGVGTLRTARIEWTPDGNAIRVKDPPDATREEVAQAAWGSMQYASRLSGHAPLFSSTHDAAGNQQSGSAEALLASASGSQAALSQSTPVTKDVAPLEVAATMRENMKSLQGIRGQAQRFGQGRLVDPAIKRLDERSRRIAGQQPGVAAPSPDEAKQWAGQANDQQQVLRKIGNSYGVLILQLDGYIDVKADPGGFNLPSYMRETLYYTAEEFSNAAAVSDLPSTASQRLTHAEQRLQQYAVEMLEGALRHILQASHDAKQGQDKQNAGQYQVREQKLRAELSQVRALLMSDPKAAQARLKKLQSDIMDLQTETDLAANFDSLDEAWKALSDADGFWATVTFISGDLEKLKEETRTWYGRWSQVRTLWQSGKTAEARTEFQKVAGDPKFQTFMRRVITKVQDAQKRALIGKLIAVIAITLVTMGVGAWVSGFVGGSVATGGLGASALTTGVAAAGAEALTFTILSTLLVTDHPTVQGFVGELIFNFAMFGALRALSTGIRALGIAKSLTEGGKVSAKAAKVIAAGTEITAQGAAATIIALARQQIETRVTQGRAPTREEVEMVLIQSAVMFVALVVSAQVAKPIFTRLQGHGSVIGTRVRIANQVRANLKVQAQALAEGGDPAAARELIAKDRARINNERALIEDLIKEGKRDPKILKDAGLTEAELRQLATAMNQADANLSRSSLMLDMEQIGPDRFAAPTDRIDGLLNQHRGAGAKIKELPADPVTKLRSWEIAYPDGAKLELVERFDTGRQAVLEAQARVTALEAQPGSGVKAAPEAAGTSALDQAKTAAGPTGSPTQILNHLRTLLPEPAQRGLDAFRTQMAGRDATGPSDVGDNKALRAIEGAGRTQNLGQFLAEKGMTTAERDVLKAQLLEARAQLALARLRTIGVIDDPAVTSRLRIEIDGLVRELRTQNADQAKFDELTGKHNVTEIIAELGEALARVQLRNESVTGHANREIIANVEIVKKVPGFSKIHDWQLAERAAGREGNPGGLYEKDGALWKSVTEVDAIVVERGADGKLKPVIFEQVKTGAGDLPGDISGMGSGTDPSPNSAAGQNLKAIRALRTLAGGATDIQIFERVGKNTLGPNLTSKFDLANVAAGTEANVMGTMTQTRGMPGKAGFNHTLDFGSENASADAARAVLEKIARHLLATEALLRFQTGTPPGGGPGSSFILPAPGNLNRSTPHPPAVKPEKPIP